MLLFGRAIVLIVNFEFKLKFGRVFGASDASERWILHHIDRDVLALGHVHGNSWADVEGRSTSECMDEVSGMDGHQESVLQLRANDLPKDRSDASRENCEKLQIRKARGCGERGTTNQYKALLRNVVDEDCCYFEM